MKSFTICTILSTIAATPAMAESFTRDGTIYTYEISSRSGYQVISGTASKSGDAFRLIVRGDKVSGQFGGKPVQFRVSTIVPAMAAGSPLLVAAK